MSGMIDMHCHIIPGVDDGAVTRSDMRRMLRMEYRSGVRKIIMTPHYRKRMFEPPEELVRKRAEYVRREIEALGIDMEVFLGCEYHANSDMLKDISENSIFRMNGGRYVLVEFSSRHSFLIIRNRIYELCAEGFKPVIAHIERYPQIVQKPEQVEELIRLGALIQVDAGALIGQDGWRLKKVSRKLLKDGRIDFIGSDAHDTKRRPPNLDLCYKYVVKAMGEKYAGELFCTNALKMLKK